MSGDTKSCPICGGEPRKYRIDNLNLQFLNDRAKDGKINAAISLARIIWSNIPQLRLTADSKAIVEGLSEAMSKDLQNRVNAILKSLKVFTETIPQLLEKLPEEIKKDLREEFEETKSKLEEEFRLLRESAPTFGDLTDAFQCIIERIESTTRKEIEEFKRDLEAKFKETLKKSGFPEPDQMRLLARLVPCVLPLLEELLRVHRTPSEKGRRGEHELWRELNDYFPEDEYIRLGKSGDTDILAKLRHNGIDLGWKVLIESKRNRSGWNRSFIRQVQRHMTLRREKFAILAVEVMPKGANGFLVEPCPEGVILITSRENFKVAYGALKAVLIALYPLKAKPVDLKKLLMDKRIEQAIRDAYQYQDYLRNIREKALRIINSARGISQNADDLDDCLRRSLKELQHRIKSAVKEIQEKTLESM
jgi:BMFP domain-containing protein YqiC